MRTRSLDSKQQEMSAGVQGTHHALCLAQPTQQQPREAQAQLSSLVLVVCGIDKLPVCLYLRHTVQVGGNLPNAFSELSAAVGAFGRCCVCFRFAGMCDRVKERRSEGVKE